MDDDSYFCEPLKVSRWQMLQLKKLAEDRGVSVESEIATLLSFAMNYDIKVDPIYGVIKKIMEYEPGSRLVLECPLPLSLDVSNRITLSLWEIWASAPKRDRILILEEGLSLKAVPKDAVQTVYEIPAPKRAASCPGHREGSIGCDAS